MCSLLNYGKPAFLIKTAALFQIPAWLNRAVNRNRKERDVLFKIGVDLLQGDIGAVLV